MPFKDTARDEAIAALRAARDEVARVCREIGDDSAAEHDAQRTVDQISKLLIRFEFEVETGVAGLAGAFRATRRRHDADAMRKGLQHGHVAFLVPVAESDVTGLAAVLGAAIGLGASFVEEFGTITVIGYPDDAALVAMARAEIFDEFDAVFGARAADPGDGYCYTIDNTGDTLALRTAIVSIDGEMAPLVDAFSAEADALSDPNRIDVDPTASGVSLTLTGRTSIDVRELSASVQRLVDETPGAAVSFVEPIDDMIVNRILARRVKTYSDTLGYKMDKIRTSEPAPATGWGNVSQAAPAFLLNFPLAVTPASADAAAFVRGSRESLDRALQFAESLCMTGIDVLRDMEYRSIADDQLVKALAKRGVSRPHRRWLGVHRVIKDPAANGKNGKKGPKLADFRMVRGPGMRDN